MSLFDMIKGKAAELLTGASDKVSDLTGIDLPGGEIADQLTRSADGLADTRQNLADAAGTVGETSTGTVTDATDAGPRG
jgi:hypothetical protein